MESALFPRNCIGQSFAMHEMKVAVARILRRFTLKVDPERPAKHMIQVVMKTEDGMYMSVERRRPDDGGQELVGETVDKPSCNGDANIYMNGKVNGHTNHVADQ